MESRIALFTQSENVLITYVCALLSMYVIGVTEDEARIVGNRTAFFKKEKKTQTYSKHHFYYNFLLRFADRPNLCAITLFAVTTEI